ncbi:MAG: proton-conducting transporter membrane subunit [Acidimicrobiales bacterium]
MAITVLLAPLVVAALLLVVAPGRRAEALSVASSLVVLAGGVALAVATGHGRVVHGLDGVVRVDALSAVMIIVIGTVASLATSAMGRTLAVTADPASRRRAREYGVLVQVFVAAMLGAVLVANLGVVWVMVEATTIATTFLVGHERSRRAIEASWKYAVLCSVGIALAFLGLVLLYFASAHAGAGPRAATLDWSGLRALAPHLDPRVTRLAVGLIVLGFGTKVGLAPLQSWLPDAHSQAPAPVSALMSGVLLTVALYAILRVRTIADAALGVGFLRTLLVVLGLASLAVAAVMMIVQRDLKRLLAYSSIEHMGLVALAIAAGTPLAIAAALLHVIGHGLVKSVLFLGAGEVHHAESTTTIAGIRSLLRRRAALGGVVAAGLVALAGLPPFSLFASEIAMFRAEIGAGLGWAAGLALAALVVIAAGLLRAGRQMLLGPGEPAVDRTPRRAIAPLVGALVVCALLGLVAWPLASLLHAAAGALS